MSKYKYTAIDPQGKQVNGQIDAPSEAAARAKLVSQKLMVASLRAEASTIESIIRAGKSAKSGSRRSTGKVKQEQLTIFTRQLATLLTAGLPLLRALEILRKQEKTPRLRNIIISLCENVQSGNNLSDSMAQHSKTFNNLYVNMIRAGEIGGVLDRVLDRLAIFMEKALRLKKKVKSAMVYPTVVISVAFVIVYVLLVKVVPQFEKMLADQKAQMPELTKIVVSFSKILIEYWYVTPVAIFLLLLLGKTIVANKRSKRVLDKVSFHLPKVGSFIVAAAVARFTRTFGTLMASGVPILQALNITRDTMSNILLAEALSTVHDHVRDGEPLSTPLEQTKVFPAMVTSMVQVGEETGRLPEMLNRVADTYDEEVDNAVGALTSIIEPLLIVFLAVVIGTVVVAMFLPLVALMENMLK
ncbi:MAG: type II secretion system F family protein [Puniceicoccales bacterium]|jgi:type IV pilus assembly protein PilC|nr:type II secretion system F family protein [Puniceicoccales bacterium]